MEIVRPCSLLCLPENDNGQTTLVTKGSTTLTRLQIRLQLSLTCLDSVRSHLVCPEYFQGQPVGETAGSPSLADKLVRIMSQISALTISIHGVQNVDRIPVLNEHTFSRL